MRRPVPVRHEKQTRQPRSALVSFLLLAPLPILTIGYVTAVATGVLESKAPPAQAAPPRPVPAEESDKARDGKNVTIAWVGDTMLGRAGALPPQGGRELFEQIRPWLRGSDVTLGNLEGVLSVGGASKCAGSDSSACFAFQAPPESAQALAWAGFDAMNIANNHSLDYGADGMAQTVQALADNDIASTGQPGQITVLRKKGTRIGLIGLAPYPWTHNMLDLDSVAELAERAASRSDVTVAMFHAGGEGSDQTRTPTGTETAFGENRGDTRKIAHTLIDNGADVVLGSGPHVIRGVERYKGRLIAYSLGNFAGWHNFAGGGVSDLTGVLKLRLTPTGVVLGGRWRSARAVSPGIPVPDDTHASARMARELSTTDFGAEAWPIGENGRLSPAP